MKRWKKVCGTLSVSLLALSLGLILWRCGEFSSPESSDEVKKTGFLIFTEEQKSYEGTVQAADCAPLALTPPDVSSAGTIEPIESVGAEWKFIIKLNPNLPEPLDYIVVDECRIQSELYELDSGWDDCGPWLLEPTLTSEATLTVKEIVFSQGDFYYLMSLGKPIPNGDSIKLSIRAKAPNGDEVEETNYAGLIITCESTRE